MLARHPHPDHMQLSPHESLGSLSARRKINLAAFKPIIWLAAPMVYFGTASSTQAQGATGWKGTTGANWSDAGNWDIGAPNDNGANLIRDLYFGQGYKAAGGAGSVTATNNLTNYSGYRITFQDSNAAGNGSDGSAANDTAFTIGGNALTLFDYGAGLFPKIQNDSFVTQTFSLTGPLSLRGEQTAGQQFAQINPVNGNLVFNNAVDLVDTTQLRIFGGSANSVTFNNAITSTGNGGANSISISANSDGRTPTVIFTGTNTYSGGTFINAGTLQFGTAASAAGTANNSTLHLGDTTGVNATATSQIVLATLAGGQTIASPINVRAGTTSAKLIVSNNTSGTNTLSGAITLGDSLTISTATGGTLEASNTIIGAKNLTKTGAGTLNLSGGTIATPSSVFNFSTSGGTTNISGVFRSTDKFIMLGGTVNSTGTVTNTGSYTGMGDNSPGTLNVTAGTFNSNPGAGLFIGNNTTGALNVSGGSFLVGTNTPVMLANGYNNNNAGTSSGTLTVSGTGTFDTGVTTGNFTLGSANAVIGTATVNLDGGTLATNRALAKGAGAGATAVVNYNGGVFKANGAAATVASTITGNVRNGGAFFNTNGFNITIPQNLVHSTIGGDNATDGGLTKNGAGTLTLSGTNTYTGVTTVGAGTLSISSASGIGNGSATNTITLAGGILSSSAGTYDLGANRNITVTATNSGIRAESGTLTVSGKITGTSGLIFTVAGAGTVNLPATGSQVGDLQISAATTNVSGTLNSLNRFVISAGGVVNWSGTGTHSGSYNGVGDFGGSGTLNVTAGTLNYASASGSFVGNSAGTGLVNITGGNMNITTNTQINLGNGYDATVGGAGNGILTVSGTGVFNTGTTTGSFILGSNLTNTGTGTINLDAGGTLSTNRSITRGASANNAATFNFNGGSLKATGSAMGISGLTTANVRNGGAVLDTNGFNVTLAQPLSHSSLGGDNAIDGGLTKNGGGKLTLTGGGSYTGPTSINTGILEVANLASISSTSAINVNGGTMLVTTSAADRIANSASLSLNANSTTIPALQFGGSAAITETLGSLSILGPNTTSIIDLGNLNTAGVGAQLTFADKGLAGSWTGKLEIWNWTGTLGVDGGIDQLDGFNFSSFTAGELANVQFYSGSGGGTAIGNGATVVNGELVAVPEPSTLMACLGLLLAPLVRRKR